jgi:hypothetical protein
MSDEYDTRPQLERVTVNLVPKASRALVDLAAMCELSRTDIVNRALQVLEYVERQRREGGTICVREPGGDLKLIEWV